MGGQGEGKEVMSLGYFKTLVIGAGMVKNRHVFYTILTHKRDYFLKGKRLISKFKVSGKLEKVSHVFPKYWFVSLGSSSAAKAGCNSDAAVGTYLLITLM